jgi:hypothetical protein
MVSGWRGGYTWWVNTRWNREGKCRQLLHRKCLKSRVWMGSVEFPDRRSSNRFCKIWAHPRTRHYTYYTCYLFIIALTLLHNRYSLIIYKRKPPHQTFLTLLPRPTRKQPFQQHCIATRPINPYQHAITLYFRSPKETHLGEEIIPLVQHLHLRRLKGCIVRNGIFRLERGFTCECRRRSFSGHSRERRVRFSRTSTDVHTTSNSNVPRLAQE